MTTAQTQAAAIPTVDLSEVSPKHARAFRALLNAHIKAETAADLDPRDRIVEQVAHAARTTLGYAILCLNDLEGEEVPYCRVTLPGWEVTTAGDSLSAIVTVSRRAHGRTPRPEPVRSSTRTFALADRWVHVVTEYWSRYGDAPGPADFDRARGLYVSVRLVDFVTREVTTPLPHRVAEMWTHLTENGKELESWRREFFTEPRSEPRKRRAAAKPAALPAPQAPRA